MEFVPFDATDEELAQRAVLRRGVPTSMRPQIVNSITRCFGTSAGEMHSDAFYEIANNFDLSFGLKPTFSGWVGGATARELMGRLTERDLMRIVDFALYKRSSSADPVALSVILREGRSAYEVVERGNTMRLANRVPEGVQVAAERLMDGSAAGLLLRRAWEKVHDLVPDDSGAYSAAVKAVEAAVLPVLGITKETATISDAVRVIEKRDSSWRLPFQREHTEYPSRDVLLGLLKSLYRGQRDRHGSEAYSDVSHDEALAAALLAVTLVGWFTSGLVQERDTAKFG